MERLYTRLDAIRCAVGRLALAACCLFFLLCLVLLSIDVVVRYTVRGSIQHVAEIVTILFTWVYLVGAAALYMRNEDIVLDFLYKRVPEQARALWLLLVYVAIAITMLIVLQETLSLMQIQASIKTPSLRLPVGVETAALALAAALIAFTSIVDALSCLIWLVSGHRPESALQENWEINS
jgi:TRAP-type C4-dicarboxylate transport system permease small subunit